MPPARKVHPAIKVAIALVLLAGLGYLFVRSAQDTRAEPYQVSARHLTGWTLGIDTASDADGAVVSLRPPAELPMNLFRQLFSRQMESMGTPSAPGIALVLRRELPDSVTADEVLALARSSGLERATLQPKCVGYQRVSATGVTRQLYFLTFDVSGFTAFRQALAPKAAAGYDAATLSPLMMMAAQPNFVGWLPIANAERDCIAPVVIS
jgi:hypothetical protein